MTSNDIAKDINTYFEEKMHVFISPFNLITLDFVSFKLKIYV
jgi:hypothetical protein